MASTTSTSAMTRSARMLLCYRGRPSDTTASRGCWTTIARCAITDPSEETTMTVSLVTYAADGRVGIVTLNRPDKLNAISPELKRQLVERLHEADRDPATSVVVLRAE